MRITSFNIHGITKVRVERDGTADGGTRWTTFHFDAEDGALPLSVTVFTDDASDHVAVETRADEPRTLHQHLLDTPQAHLVEGR